jgi:hypothetical protein
MAIATEWDVDFTNKVISHIDGTMAWQSAAGDPPDAGDYIKGGTSNAVGKLLDSSVDYSTATGTAKIGNVNGTFVDTETLAGLAFVTFDSASNGGFEVGDTLQNSGATIVFDVDAIEYNTANDGTGTMWGVETTGQVINTTSLRKSTATSVEVCIGTSTTVAAHAWTSAVVNSTNGLDPATITRIVNYDTGTIAIPRFARIDDGVGGATGQVQNVVGVTATGSLRVVDIPSGQSFGDGETIRLLDNIYYDGQIGGQKFRVNDTVLGDSSGATGKIIAINETVPGTSGDFTLLNLTGGPFTNNENISVGGTVIAVVEAAAGDQAAFVKDVAVVNGAEITEQLSTQGGIYIAASNSLNGVRDLNSLYTFLQDTFDELGALDDEVPMTAQVKLQQYTLINDWIIPDASYNFLQSGSVQDAALANIWTNYTTIGSVAGITDTGYLPTATPIPQIYIEQDGSVIDTFWLAAHIDVLVKVTSNSSTTLAVGAAPDFTDGININGGTVTLFARRYGDTYDHFETTTIAGVAPIPIATAADINNTTGTHSFDCNTTTGYAVGEEFVETSDPTKRGVVTALDTGPTGLSYIFTGTTQFANADVIANQVSTSLATLSSTITSEVAAYGMDAAGSSGKMIVATVNGTQAHGAVTAGPFHEGEMITQAVTGAQAIMMDDTANVFTLGNQLLDGSGAIIEFDATNTVTGVTSGANCTPSVTTHTSLSTIDRDIDDGNGDQPYNSVIYMNSQNDGGDTLARMYEWIKYRTRGLTVGGIGETTGEVPYGLLGAPGENESGLQGRVYITLDSTYPLVKASPFGTFAGGTFFGATGVFIQDMAAADIRNYQLIDNNSVLRSPPNLQSLTAAGLVVGDRVAVFRRPNTTAGSGINTTEYTLDSVASTFNDSGDTFIRVQAAIATDTPASGVVRVFDADTGNFLSYDYDSFTDQEFTLPATLGSALTVSSNTFVPLIEREATGTSESVNLKYQADIPLLARVRKKGILPFEVEGTFGSAGATVTAIRTTDTIVD